MNMIPNADTEVDPKNGADDAVWKALASPLRRRILDELRSGPLRTSDLTERFDQSRHVVMQHLAVLRDADLVRTAARGRIRMNHLNPVPIQRIHRRWVSQYEGLWAEALLGLKERLETEDPTVDEREKRSG